jgi:hypothetical protein
MRSWTRILQETPDSILLCLFLENPISGMHYLTHFVPGVVGEPMVLHQDQRVGEEEPGFVPKDGDNLNQWVFFLPLDCNPLDTLLSENCFVDFRDALVILLLAVLYN